MPPPRALSVEVPIGTRVPEPEHLGAPLARSTFSRSLVPNEPKSRDILNTLQLDSETCWVAQEGQGREKDPPKPRRAGEESSREDAPRWPRRPEFAAALPETQRSEPPAPAYGSANEAVRGRASASRQGSRQTARPAGLAALPGCGRREGPRGPTSRGPA